MTTRPISAGNKVNGPRRLYFRFPLYLGVALLTVILLSYGIYYYLVNYEYQPVADWALFILGIFAGCDIFGITYWLVRIDKAH